MAKANKSNNYSKRRKTLLFCMASIVYWGAVTIFLAFSIFYIVPSLEQDARVYLNRLANKKSYELSKPALFAFQEESKALSPTISAIVGDKSPEPWDQCDTYETTTTHTWAECTYYVDYLPTEKPTSATISNQIANTQKLIQLLVSRGWKPWGPNYSIQDIAAKNILAPANPGEYATIEYHKKIGDVICSLQIDFFALHNNDQTGGKTPASLSCSQKVDYPHKNPKNREPNGEA